MSEDKKNQDQNAKVEQIPSDETQTEYRKISQIELDQVIKNHKKWLDTDGKEGQRADLPDFDLSKKTFLDIDFSQAFFDRANLQNTDFSGCTLQKTIFSDALLQNANFSNAEMQGSSFNGANMTEAILVKSKLQNANLSSSILRKANLSGSELIGTNLNNADMQNTNLLDVKSFADADLKYANLEDVTGLLGNEFGKADVTGTKLPEYIKEFKALETVEKTSQNARKIFFAMLLGCVYSWLTIATTTDVRLLTNTASSALPVIGTEIPIAWFYIAAPLVLICLYFYFHLYLDNLWKGLASLPAIFPDGRPIDQRAYPWLLNSLVNRHFRKLKMHTELKKFEKLKAIIEKVLKKFNIEKEIYIRPIIYYLKEWITIFLAWCVVPITMIAFWLRYIPRHEWWGTIFHIGLIVLSVAFGIIFYRLCALTLRGKKKAVFRLKKFWGDRRFNYVVGVVAVGILFSMLSYGSIYGVRAPTPSSNIFQDIIPYVFRKLGYEVFADFQEKRVSEIPLNYGAISKEERLEFVKGANLNGRNLENADMLRAFLVKADLREALLSGATLQGANLQQADISQATLIGADLLKANLQQVNFTISNLQEAVLYQANLQQGILRIANLQQANFWRANLQKADLERANLQKANLQEANFMYADLTGAKNLTIEQLSKVKTLYKTKLDPELMEQVKECCSHLLEMPKDKTDERDETE